MRRNRGTDDLKQLVVLRPLSKNIPTASPKNAVCLGNRLIWPLQMHHAVTTNNMIEGVGFIGQAFRIALPEPDVRMVLSGLGDNRRREIQSFRIGAGTDQRGCKVT